MMFAMATYPQIKCESINQCSCIKRLFVITTIISCLLIKIYYKRQSGELFFLQKFSKLWKANSDNEYMRKNLVGGDGSRYTQIRSSTKREWKKLNLIISSFILFMLNWLMNSLSVVSNWKCSKSLLKLKNTSNYCKYQYYFKSIKVDSKFDDKLVLTSLYSTTF